MEGDSKTERGKHFFFKFQSTPSAWRETKYLVSVLAGIRNFNPLPPHGGRQDYQHTLLCATEFQSTPSAWRETSIQPITVPPFLISIHSLRMEGDGSRYCPWITGLVFQSTPSAWRETSPLGHNSGRGDVFQSTPSAWRETKGSAILECSVGFQSTPSAWRETIESPYFAQIPAISIHSLRMEGD